MNQAQKVQKTIRLGELVDILTVMRDAHGPDVPVMSAADSGMIGDVRELVIGAGDDVYLQLMDPAWYEF